ncbi:lipopolysaccharide biosynthesis protein [Agrobacterium larrymoorei]|uniref:O-antigen/teichoic acid export membrane protein n=1 Tax=Agrobacterium larrymoorei TaxID=160699 RepID=A0ABU0UGS0_9HYPH|nr:oligosaccharide flippase family protein [Agrobacterium larrymoorei]MDQ1184131.1 O-antigen/teichoic acid export membrane protein [Agrobacterium larrymoorei]
MNRSGHYSIPASKGPWKLRFRMPMRYVRDALPLMRSLIAYAAMPAAGIITAPILAHALGATGRGQLAGILQPMTLAAAVAALGVPSAVTYFIGRQSPPGKVIRLAVVIALIMTFLVGLALFWYSARIAEQLDISRTFLLLIWAAFLPSALIAIRRGHIQGLRRYGALDLERMLGSGLRVGAIVLLWIIGVKSVIAFAAIYMIAGLSASAVLRLPGNANAANTLRRQSGNIIPEFTSASFFSYAILSAFGTIAATVSARLDQAIMPAIVATNDLGYYSVAVTVAEVPGIITAVLTRNVLAEVAGGIHRQSVLRSILLGGFAQVALTIVILVSLPYAVPIVFGGDFAPAVALIRILLLGTFIGYWANVVAAYLGGLGRPGYNSLGQAAAAFTTIILFWAAWQRMGAATAAWISVWSQAAALATALVLVTRLSPRGQSRNVSNPNAEDAN